MADSKKHANVKVALVWGDNPDLRTIHANHVWLTQQEGDVFLTFGELLPVSPKREAPAKAVIQPVARISLSPEALVRMTRLLLDNVDLPAESNQ